MLTTAHGFTVYWFAPDTPKRSNCDGVCAGYWPPVTGTPAAGQGIPGKLGTIKRSDGTAQVTYNGHPLYTYVGDTAPGQAFGNNLNLNGGLWHEITLSRSETRFRAVSWGFAAESGAWLGPSRGAAVARLPLDEVPAGPTWRSS